MHVTGEALRTCARYISVCAVNPVLCVSVVLLRLCYCGSAAFCVRTECMVSCFHTVGGINERCDNGRTTPVVVSLYGDRTYWSPRLSRRGRALLGLFGLFGTGTGWKLDEFKASKTRLRRLVSIATIISARLPRSTGPRVYSACNDTCASGCFRRDN